MKVNNNWQADMDAETLMRYNEIISNKNRYAKAVRKALSRADEYRRKAEAFDALDNNKRTTKRTKK